MELILLGYMACGKSTIGRYLSEKMDLTFIDLDAYIEENEGMTISQLFSSKGEIYFRKQEAFYLNKILNSTSNYILALGGGTPCYGTNMKSIVESKAHNIYLKASIPTLVKRLEEGKQNRPLIADLDDDQLIEYIGKHLFERAPFYEQSKLKLKIDSKSIEEVSSEIIELLH